MAMKKFLIAAAASGLLAFATAGYAAASSAYPPGNAKAGQQKSGQCAACHGADGNSATAQFPKLAGQNTAYIAKELADFKSRARKNPIMNAMAAGLSEQDMKDLAAYFSQQTIKPGAANPKLVAQGRALYLGGDAERGVPACAACHSPTGAGNAPAAWPALAGQYQEYLVAQLKAWRSGSRKNDPKAMMRQVAQNMTDQEIEAVASYLQGLHTAQAATSPAPGQSANGR